jgi:hypothetical protein
MHEYLGDLVEQDQERLNQVEESVAVAKENTHAAVETLIDASNDKTDRLSLVAPLLGSAILGVSLLSPGTCVAALAVKAVLVTGTTGASYVGTKKLSAWQKQAIAHMKDQLPHAFSPVPANEAEMLRIAGSEASRRLVMKLSDSKSWTLTQSLSGRVASLRAWERTSDVRNDGRAYSTSFEIGISAKEAFLMLRRHAATGSLDPGCKVAWSRPIDDTGTSMRYLIFANIFYNRDFFCICRAARADDVVPSEDSHGRERYVFACMTLGPDLLAGTALPTPDAKYEHGIMHTCGVMVEDCGANGCTVQVMCDIDPVAPSIVGRRLVDRQVRLHLIRTAAQMRGAFTSRERDCAELK